jgi:hypothetical protein
VQIYEVYFNIFNCKGKKYALRPVNPAIVAGV